MEAAMCSATTGRSVWVLLLELVDGARVPEPTEEDEWCGIPSYAVLDGDEADDGRVDPGEPRGTSAQARASAGSMGSSISSTRLTRIGARSSGP
nr:unnamed protein product [Digitaria exilis]